MTSSFTQNDFFGTLPKGSQRISPATAVAVNPRFPAGGAVGGVAAGGGTFAWLEEVRTSAGPGRSTGLGGMIGMVSGGDWV